MLAYRETDGELMVSRQQRSPNGRVEKGVWCNVNGLAGNKDLDAGLSFDVFRFGDLTKCICDDDDMI